MGTAGRHYYPHVLHESKIIAFAATSKPQSARIFYERTLGLRLVADEPFALVFDANGTTLRIQKVQSHTAPDHTVLGWQVADITAAIYELIARGVKFQRYPGMQQDALGIWKSPSGGKIAWFKDPDGNILSLTQPASA